MIDVSIDTIGIKITFMSVMTMIDNFFKWKFITSQEVNESNLS